MAGHGVGGKVFLPGADEPLAILFVAMPDNVVAAGERPLQVRLGGRLAVPDRNLVSPPKLPADRPVALLAQPIDIALGVALGNDPDAAVGDRVHGRLRQPLHLDEPLIGQQRLDGRLRAVAVGQVDLAILDLHQQAELVQIGHHVFAGDEDRLAAIRPGLSLERAVEVEDVDHRQLLPQADFVVVRVVGRGDLDAAGAQLGLRPNVGHQRDLAVRPAATAACGRPGPCRAARATRGAWSRGAGGRRPTRPRFPASAWPARRPAGPPSRPRPCPARRPDRDGPPRPCRPASSPAAWWRWSRAWARRAADRSPDS